MNKKIFNVLEKTLHVAFSILVEQGEGLLTLEAF